MVSLNPQQFSPAMMPKRRPEPAVRQEPEQEGYSLSPHAAKQSGLKGWDHNDVLDAANDPTTTYENGRYPGQMRHIKNGIVAVVDPVRKHVVTVYENVRETDLRPDQKDRDAQRYGRRR